MNKFFCNSSSFILYTVLEQMHQGYILSLKYYQICKVNKINMCTMIILVMHFLCYMLHCQKARVRGKLLSSVFYQGILCVGQ